MNTYTNEELVDLIEYHKQYVGVVGHMVLKSETYLASALSTVYLSELYGSNPAKSWLYTKTGLESRLTSYATLYGNGFRNKIMRALYVLFDIPLEDLLLCINEEDDNVALVARWRLKVGK